MKTVELEVKWVDDCTKVTESTEEGIVVVFRVMVKEETGVREGGRER